MSTIGWIVVTLGAIWLPSIAAMFGWIVCSEVAYRRNRSAIEQEDCLVRVLEAELLAGMLTP